MPRLRTQTRLPPLETYLRQLRRQSEVGHRLQRYGQLGTLANLPDGRSPNLLQLEDPKGIKGINEIKGS